MSASTQTIAALRAKEQADLNKALERNKLINRVLDSMPADSPAPIRVFDNGYCASASLIFEGDGLARRLYDMYPPLACVDVKGHDQTQKPVSYLRDEDRRKAIRPIFPVVFKSSMLDAAARWWTELDGLTIEVSVRGAAAVEFADLISGEAYAFTLKSTYSADSHHYSTGSVGFYPRNLASPKVRPAAMVAWNNEWEIFGQSLNFNDEQLRFLKVARFFVHMRHFEQKSCEEHLSREDLANLDDAPGVRHGRFSELFAEDEQNKVLVFSQGQAKALTGALEKQRADFDTVESWFSGFIGSHGYLYDDDLVTKQYIVHKLHKDTGLDVTIRSMRTTRGGVSVSAYFKGCDTCSDWHFAFSDKADKERLLPQDIDVEYL